MTGISPKNGCCAPPRQSRTTAVEQSFLDGGVHLSGVPQAVFVPGGKSLVGTDSPGIRDDGENPLRNTEVKPFRMATTVVTNAQFKSFVDATGFLTEAERFGWSFVFAAQVPANVGGTEGVAKAEWWRRVDGANWQDINGPATKSDTWFPDHPVVHVSWNDATAYARWVGGRLPSEVEWEHAARGGLGDVKFPWGDDEPDDVDFLPCNIWQGRFPTSNTAKDGFLTTAPAEHYAPNGYGLYNMVGNVWEWTSDAYRIKSLKKSVIRRLAEMKGYKLSKGGSFLCHRSYCYRYRIAARSGTSPDSTTTHHGFRVAWPV
ncbi:formylglycine-generating enzyme family protein [Nioella sp.]|uniref:formylglycine-generating enzyme family protein n=1 Tax=Nioella sp. TaxID=1912091 RepID=UPI003A857C89